MAIYYESELYHHGIKGQRWGVRRYQNYDGSYTQRGVKRYHQALDKRNEAATKLNEVLKSGSKTDIKYARANFKKARAGEAKAYKKLKDDKRADQGKELYKKGKTIYSNTKGYEFSQLGIGVGAAAAQRIIRSKTGNIKASNIAASSIAIGGTAVNAILYGKTWYENRRLRAYYAH